ncbi:MAG: hypothetical protein EA408_00465 [Marinilabiliales bacterium]|nr:MAG: hypothetical protein EA408_00465 [Marinilabiliales bacterium]
MPCRSATDSQWQGYDLLFSCPGEKEVGCETGISKYSFNNNQIYDDIINKIFKKNKMYKNPFFLTG